MLPEFTLERWLRAQEKRARLAIGGSGVARGDIAPYLPEDMARAWATHPDEASRALREAVARHAGVDAAHVLPTAGASEADAAAALGLAGPGARVLVHQPAYHALLAPPLAMGCKVERATRLPSRLAPDTKLVLLARPNNPTGAVVPEDEMLALADEAARVGAWVLVDEVFAEATALAPVRHPRILRVNSLTKCYGFSGLRCGWVIGAPEALEAIDRAKSHLSVQNALLDLLVGARVLADAPRILERTRRTRRLNAQVLADFLEGAIALTGAVPAHGTTGLLALPAGTDDIKFCEGLAREHGVVMPPGSYIESPGHVRVGLVGDADKLGEGLAIAEKALLP